MSANPKNSTRFTQALKAFRQCLESELGQPITHLDPSALLLFNDLCAFLKADPRQVLGPKGVRRIKAITG